MFFSIIVAEVLSIFIDVNINIIGIQIGDHEMEVVNFTDDTTILLRNFSFLTKIELVLELCDTTQKMKFSIKDFFSKCDQICKYTEEILNGKLHFLCSVKKPLAQKLTFQKSHIL